MYLEHLLLGHEFSLRGDELEPNEDGLKFYDEMFDELSKIWYSTRYYIKHILKCLMALAKEIWWIGEIDKLIDMFR